MSLITRASKENLISEPNVFPNNIIHKATAWSFFTPLLVRLYFRSASRQLHKDIQSSMDVQVIVDQNKIDKNIMGLLCFSSPQIS